MQSGIESGTKATALAAESKVAAYQRWLFTYRRGYTVATVLAIKPP